jgi:hypothetical protein
MFSPMVKFCFSLVALSFWEGWAKKNPHQDDED